MFFLFLFQNLLHATCSSIFLLSLEPNEACDIDKSLAPSSQFSQDITEICIFTPNQEPCHQRNFLFFPRSAPANSALFQLDYVKFVYKIEILANRITYQICIFWQIHVKMFGSRIDSTECFDYYIPSL